MSNLGNKGLIALIIVLALLSFTLYAQLQKSNERTIECGARITEQNIAIETISRNYQREIDEQKAREQKASFDMESYKSETDKIMASPISKDCKTAVEAGVTFAKKMKYFND